MLQLFIKRFTVGVLCIMFCAVSAHADPGTVRLDYLGTNELSGGKPTRDTTPSINILDRFYWNVTVIKNDKDTIRFGTSQPDTISYNEPFTACLSSNFQVAPALLNQLYSFYYNAEGSMIVKLNGSILVSTGKYDPGKTNNELKDGYVNFFFKDTLSRLDIIYLPHRGKNFINVNLMIHQLKSAEYEQKIHVRNINESFAFGFYYLAFGIIFIILFAFFRERKENLYFSLFCLCAALSFLWKDMFGNTLQGNSTFFFIFSLEFLSIFFARIFKNKEKSKIPLLVILVISIISFHPFILYYYIFLFGNHVPLIRGIIFAVLGGYAILSSIYFLIQGIGQKQWEAKAVVYIITITACVFFVAPFIVFGIVAPRHMELIPIANTIMHYMSDIGLCIYPLSAAIVLGRRNGLNQKKLIEQIGSIQKLSAENMAKEIEKQQMLETEKDRLEQEVAVRTTEIVAQKEEIQKQHTDLKAEKKKSDDLLLNILPEEIAEELKEKGRSAARLFNDVTVLFTDFVDFTKAAETRPPQELVDELDVCFKAFDDIISKYGCEKIKTIGDAYLAVSGLPVADAAHAEKIALCALEIIQFMSERKRQGANTFDVRIGIHSGSVVAGIVGVKKFAYDIWGDTVNTAARMEQNSAPGKINCSQTTFSLIKDKFNCTYRGEITAKNKGELSMYFIEGAMG